MEFYASSYDRSVGSDVDSDLPPADLASNSGHVSRRRPRRKRKRGERRERREEREEKNRPLLR